MCRVWRSNILAPDISKQGSQRVPKRSVASLKGRDDCIGSMRSSSPAALEHGPYGWLQSHAEQSKGRLHRRLQCDCCAGLRAWPWSMCTSQRDTRNVQAEGANLLPFCPDHHRVAPSHQADTTSNKLGNTEDSDWIPAEQNHCSQESGVPTSDF